MSCKLTEITQLINKYQHMHKVQEELLAAGVDVLGED